MVRIFDFCFSLVALICFFPIGVLIAFLIVIDDFGPIFYKQERVGRFSKKFKVFKFRSMKVAQNQNASLITIGMRDPRITRIGYLIRKLKLDEFPQFLNVLIGQMSVVGPRPEVEKYTNLYSEEQRKVLTVRPGITDRASLEYFEENKILGESNDPNKTYIEEIMPAKLAINLKYIDGYSLKEVIQVISLTIVRILK